MKFYQNIKESAGLVVIWNKKILLTHPTNAPWYGFHNIPKGLIELGEDKIDAAIRETKEETGIEFTRNQVDPTEYVVDYTKGKNIYKKVYYFFIRLDKFDYEIIPKENFKPNVEGIVEVDWAGFLNYEEAKKRIFWRFEELLEYVK